MQAAYLKGLNPKLNEKRIIEGLACEVLMSVVEDEEWVAGGSDLRYKHHRHHHHSQSNLINYNRSHAATAPPAADNCDADSDEIDENK